MGKKREKRKAGKKLFNSYSDLLLEVIILKHSKFNINQSLYRKWMFFLGACRRKIYLPNIFI